jgi:hypothetical protein
MLKFLQGLNATFKPVSQLHPKRNELSQQVLSLSLGRGQRGIFEAARYVVLIV